MHLLRTKGGFSLIEVIVAVAVFVIFALGIYSATVFVYKIVYQSRITILETALLSEELETVRNLPYESIGVSGGIPSGVLSPTKTANRNGAEFNLVTTVRNVDDPFDGTLGGNPDDTSPADYKFVEISAICAHCAQQTPVVLSTQVGPKDLEGSSQNGAIFIHVFDANGQPVTNANVFISNAVLVPPIAINDVTGNDGYLRILGAPTSTLSYAITVSKAGYSTDKTITSTPGVPNPIKPPANVASQMITDISFSIDRVSNLAVETKSATCAPLGSIPFNLQGEKVIGTNPAVYKYRQSFTSDGNGTIDIENIEWDTYSVSTTGGAYDVAGTIPMAPLSVVPGSNVHLDLILRAHTANSLLVKVQDSATKLPLSNVTAELTNGGYYQSVLTGLGYRRQTDWSDGSGAIEFVEGSYFSDDGNLAVNSPAGDVKLKKVGNSYLSDAWLESATFDLGTQVDLNTIVITPTTQPPQAGSQPVLFKIATSNSSTPTAWDFLGPDGAANSFYSTTSTVIHAAHSGKRYLRYRAYLHTDDTGFTPNLSEVAFTYTTSCTPPGQAFFDNLSASTYTLTLNAAGYANTVLTIDVAGQTDVLVLLAHEE